MSIKNSHCQGCALSLLLVNIVFAAVLDPKQRLQRFPTDTAIRATLVHLYEGIGDTEEDALIAVRQAAWGMMYADRARFVPRSPERLAKLMAVDVKLCEVVGVTVPEEKRETTPLRKRGDRSGQA